jgi:Rrf2 family protein
MVDLAQHYNDGPVRLSDISRRQDISLKYLEQLIIPLKKNGLVKSVRGPKGGHMLASTPETMTVAEIVRVLEGRMDLTICIGDPSICERSPYCITRGLWEKATNAMICELERITLEDLVKRGQSPAQMGRF